MRCCDVHYVLQSGLSAKRLEPNLGSLDDEIKKVFDFKSGQFAYTKGMHILDEPFIIDFFENGEKKEVCKTIKIRPIC